MNQGHPEMGRLDGKVALVTGASRGVGRAIAVELAGLGANVAITARTAGAGSGRLTGSLLETAGAVQAAGVRCLSLPADLQHQPERARIVADTVDSLGRLDILINNAADTGDNVFRGFWETPATEWDAQVNLNLNAPYALMKECGPVMRDHGGA